VCQSTGVRLSASRTHLAGALSRTVLTTVVVAIATAGLGGCGGDTPERVAARVGRVAITSQEVEHWAVALAGGHLPRSPVSRNALRARALNYLIFSDWRFAEVAAEGLELSRQEVQRQLAFTQSQSFPGGKREMSEYLKATGSTHADLVFQARAELASAKLRQAVVSRQRPIGETQVVSYYRRHRQLFTTPEQRNVLFTNRLSQAAALAVRREVAAGRSFTTLALPMSVPLSPKSYSLSIGHDAALARAIHFARPNVLTGPVLVNHVDHYVFEVKAIRPARVQPLRQVRGAILRQLVAEQQRRALSAFIKAWRRRWIARTNCAVGYIVQKCRQHRGARAPEDSGAFN
jgi:foldase protein PrsA